MMQEEGNTLIKEENRQNSPMCGIYMHQLLRYQTIQMVTFFAFNYSVGNRDQRNTERL